MRRLGRFLVCLMLAGLAPLAAAAGGVAYVNYAELLQKAPQSSASDVTLKQQFSSTLEKIGQDEKTVKALHDRIVNLDPEANALERASLAEKLKAAQGTLQKDQSVYQMAFSLRRQQLSGNFQRLVQNEIDSYARAHGFSVVLQQGVLYAAPDADITQAILARLQQDYAAARAAARKHP